MTGRERSSLALGLAGVLLLAGGAELAATSAAPVDGPVSLPASRALVAAVQTATLTVDGMT